MRVPVKGLYKGLGLRGLEFRVLPGNPMTYRSEDLYVEIISE